ncbi:MAG: SDR family oxidoreductase [Candidatus Hydrogenedentes bacterium]|nr:SDR family oxidoreductase [Candidatus Hydrogenedentota bacterium]
MNQDPCSILVTGASGYIGGRLAPHLAAKGLTVRCMGRKLDTLRSRFPESIEVTYGDVLDRASLDNALAGVETAYYLIHALEAPRDFESIEERGARNFAAAARAAGVRRIVYLGGLSSGNSAHSRHMRSREAVGAILRESGVPTIELRASVVIGAGSLSFELIRALVRRLPVMIAPRWVSIPAQPIAVNDVLAYLDEAREIPCEESRVYEIGGADQLSYRDLMLEYAKTQGLRRIIIDVPFLTPWLSSLWLSLVTPVLASVGRKLIESICIASIVRDERALEDFSVRPAGIQEAIAAAHREEDARIVASHWADAASASGHRRPWGGEHFGARILDSRTARVDVPPAQAFAPIRRIGGKTGWYYGNALWRLRGLIDKLLGGVGLGRGRRDPDTVRLGDTIDWWRVEAFEPDALLVLRAEMRVPGRAWLRFEVTPEEGGPGAVITQTAIYDPAGLAGLLYWYALYPIHEFIFAGMCRNIARAAERESARAAEKA